MAPRIGTLLARAIAGSGAHQKRQAQTVPAAEPAAEPAAAPATSSTYIGIGVGVGGAMFIALVFVAVQIARRRRHHRREIEALQVEQAVSNAYDQEVAEIPRPVNSLRCSSLGPLNGSAGWGALYSDETIHEPQVSKGKRGKRSSVSLPKRFKQRSVHLKRLKRLTAIAESPRSKPPASPRPIAGATENQHGTSGAEAAPSPQINPKAYTLRMVQDEDVFICPGSPNADVLPSFAIRSPGRYGSGIATDNESKIAKAGRSRSVGGLTVPPAYYTNSFPPPRPRPPMHSRSISLGAPTTLPPSRPVPPLPLTVPRVPGEQHLSRRGLLVSRVSSSSEESTGSSVLVASPILTMKDKTQPLASPCVEEVVAEDDAASLKTVSQKQWSSPTLGAMAADGIPPVPSTAPLTAHNSIRSNIARYSINSQDSHRASTVTIGSTNEDQNRLSIPQVGTADRVSISRVSSCSSISKSSGVHKVTTPRRASRMSVSANGSPAERKKTSVLRDISGNAIAPPTRRHSNATNHSGTSSNGNPFQWDTQPMAKPSALKGSPNARKGHRRQNCVRISTLTPQILGPPRSRPTSPGLMHGILEEGGDGEDSDDQPGLRFVTHQRTSRPNSLMASAPNLRVQTLRASITPSSPTLSAWNAFQEHGLPSEHSDSSLSISPDKRSNSRQSTASAFSIPSFPSPVRPSLSDVQLHRPVPEFCLSRPSNDIDEEPNTSPFALHNSSDSIDLPSSPPVMNSGAKEYDPAHPAWPLVDLPAPQEPEYDPTSPPTKSEQMEMERSSPYFPFTASRLTNNDDVSPCSKTEIGATGGATEDSPPCSPKRMSEGFKPFFDDRVDAPRAAEKLTSENASTIMGRTPSPTRTVDFPGAPIHAPPSDEMDAFASASAQVPPSPPPKSAARRSRTMSIAAGLQPLQLATPAAALSNDSCAVSPLHIPDKRSSRQATPQGPREQPAQSVLKYAMALRRMNSEASCNSPSLMNVDRESRQYVRLGREASPLLPWIQSPDLNNEDMDAVFDFDLAAGTAHAGAGAFEGSSVMDEINLQEIERRLEEALAGFDAMPSSDASHDTITSLGAVEKSVRRGSGWEDGEKYWEQENVPPTPSLQDLLDVTPSGTGRESDEFGWASIQCTPRSLYDSDGFLRT